MSHFGRRRGRHGYRIWKGPFYLRTNESMNWGEQPLAQQIVNWSIEYSTVIVSANNSCFQPIELASLRINIGNTWHSFYRHLGKVRNVFWPGSLIFSLDGKIVERFKFAGNNCWFPFNNFHENINSEYCFLFSPCRTFIISNPAATDRNHPIKLFIDRLCIVRGAFSHPTTPINKPALQIGRGETGRDGIIQKDQ